MEASSESSPTKSSCDHTRPSLNGRGGKVTHLPASHAEGSVDKANAEDDVIKVNPLNLEPHPILEEFSGEPTRPRYVDAFSKSTLKILVLMNTAPVVEAIQTNTRCRVIRGWEAVQLARDHKLALIAVRILTIPKKKLRDYIYLNCFLSAQAPHGRQLSSYRANLNNKLIAAESELLTGPPSRQRMNGMPLSTGYRLKGSTSGETRGRKKKGLRDTLGEPPSTSSSPEQQAKEGPDELRH